MQREVIRRALLLSGGFLGAWLCFRYLLPLFLPFVLGLLLALTAEPAVQFGLRLKLPRWAAAGIGMALGAGMYILGVATTVLLIILQVFLHAPIKAFKGRLYITLRATIIIKDDTVIQQMRDLFNINKFTKFKTVRNENVMTADVEFATNRAYSPEELYNIIQEYDFIKTLEKHEEI